MSGALVAVYCGQDIKSARRAAKKIREGGEKPILMNSFVAVVPIPCSRVIVMDDVPEFRAEIVREAYGLPTGQSDDPFDAPPPDPASRPRGRPRKITN